MAFSNIDNQNLGKFLQIAFSEGVRNQISDDYRDWEYIKRNRVGNPDGRELRFLFQTSFGPAAVQYRNPNFTANFPDPQQITTSEHTAVYKEVDVTIELEYNLWNRAQKSPSKYAEPLAWEIQAKTTASKRRLSADLYGDGTGVVGTYASSTSSSTETVVTLDTTDTARGFIGFFEFGDLLLGKNNDGTATTPTFTSSTTFFAWRVKERDRANDRVTLEPVDSSGTVLTDLTGDGLSAGDHFLRVGQPTSPDLSVSVPDYGTITEVMAGLESLVNNDGRVVHGITMSGATGGSQLDAGNVALDVTQIQTAMDNVKIAVGQGNYSWKQMMMAPEAHATLIESRETDRRFQTIEDNKRGIRYFAYVHGNDVLETVTSEYCPKKRIYMIPEARASQGKVLEYNGTDFETVKMNGMGEFHLKPSSSGGHERRITSYLEALCVLICKHPAAVASIRNFTVT